MSEKSIPNAISRLLDEGLIRDGEIKKTEDGFFLVFKSLASILAERSVLDFLDSEGERLLCEKFFDDWFLYAVPDERAFTYGLLKMREQEHDTEDLSPADGDTPGVTISFISFDTSVLFQLLADPNEDNRKKLNEEINRVVAEQGQRHHPALKRYFENPASRAPYLVADVYTRHIASFAENGFLELPACYQRILQKSISYKNSAKATRLPLFIKSVNGAAGRTVCDSEKIYVENPEQPTEYELLAILATHTGNTSVYSFAAEVEYHARFLTPLAKIKIPFFGRSVYDSAIRADMTVGDTEFEGPAPFHKNDSKIVKRQFSLHRYFCDQ